MPRWCAPTRVSPSYIAMGAVFPTTLKQMATAPQGVGAPGRLCAADARLPAGGDRRHRRQQLPEVLASGVGSVAVVRALVAAAQPEVAVVKLKSEMQTSMATQGHQCCDRSHQSR